MSIKNRYGIWHYRFKISGKIYASSTRLRATAQNRTGARQIEDEAKKAVLLGTSQPKSVSFGDAWRLFLRSYEGEVKPSSLARIATSSVALIAFLGANKMMPDLLAGDIEDFKSERRICGVKDVSIRHDLHALSLLLQYARKKEWIAKNPLDGVKIPSDKDAVRDNVLSATDEKSYFAQAMRWPDLHDICRLMIQQGMRPEEAQRIRKQDVDLENGVLTIQHGKTGAARRQLHLTAESRSILAARMGSDSPWIFPSQRKKGAPVGRLNGSHEKACIASGTDFTLYDLRHTFLTRLAESGCEPYTLAKIAGHSSLRCIMRYIHISSASAARAMRVMEARRENIVGEVRH